MELQTQTSERRRHPRTISHTTALVKTERSIYEFVVSNLSVSGALLTQGPPLRDKSIVHIVLQLPLYPEIAVTARVVRCQPDHDGRPEIGLHFLHESDMTEDHIQAALLSELERSHTHGRIPQLD